MEASLRGDLMACIIERRHEQINDELGFLGEMNPKDARPIVEAAQAAVVASLKKMRNNGTLQEYLEAAEKTPQDPASPSVNAAA
jgi:flagellar motor switch protein FliG